MRLDQTHPFSIIELARHQERPRGPFYIDSVFSDFTELHGDRCIGDDKAIVAGFARLDDRKVAVIATDKGTDTKTRIACKFGCISPSGYRKALRVMKLAEKFDMPIVSLVDTPGAYPGIESEEQGIGHLIAKLLVELSRIRVPTVSAIVGEGGSGGAIALATTDVIGMMQNSYYSVITPEGCAAILWKDKKHVKTAAKCLDPIPASLLELDLIDEIILESQPAHIDRTSAAANLRKFIVNSLNKLSLMQIDKLIERRQMRIRESGSCFESNATLELCEIA